MRKCMTILNKLKNVNRVFAIICVFCFSLLIIDIFTRKHPDFPWEGYPDFYAVYGFLCCVMLVFAARILRKFIKRDENYYG
jgi:hypothetical protein